MDVFALAEAVQAIARTGLHYAEDPYDRERYRSLLDVATAEYSDRFELPPEDVRARFAEEVGSITPKVGADAAIIDEDDRILLVRRTDDGRWGLIAGWVEPNEHPAATVVREAAEEVGLDVEVTQLAGICHRPAGAESGPHSTVSVIYLCRVVGGHLTPQPHEVIEADWRHPHDVDEWHLNHAELAQIALEAHWRL
ncbi:hypothetical protein BH23ACT5_BH23ACT5_21880 [soil metagenome]